MKLHHALIVATLSLSVFVGDSFAQDSSPWFGKGRLLKKMRDDIFGSKSKPKLPSFKPTRSTANRGVAIPSKSNVPTLALPSQGQRPAQIDSQSSHKYRTTQASKKTNTPTSGSSSSQYKTSSKPTQAAKTKAITPEQIASITRSAKRSTTAFGMLLETRGEDLVVTQLKPAGNAAKAGIRKGDLIVGAGGVKFGSMYEFNQITDVLRDGDQLEFLVGQSGKENKKLIQFGAAPDMTVREVAQTSTHRAAPVANSRPATTRSASSLNQYDLVKPNSTMHSVIASDNEVAPAPIKKGAQSWRYTSGRRSTDKQAQAIESAAVRGDTILNVAN